MKRKILALMAIVALMASPVWAKATVGSTDKGQFADIKILGAEQSDVSGNELTIDIRELNQSSATGAIPVVIFDQDDTDDSVFEVECTEGALNTCSCYTTTAAVKKGAIRVEIDNGTSTVTRWLWLYQHPN